MSALQFITGTRRSSCNAAGRVFSRAFASTSQKRVTNYIDDWQASIVRPAEFYEANSAPGLKRKNYFYNIDLQGRVFLGKLRTMHLLFLLSCLASLPTLSVAWL